MRILRTGGLPVAAALMALGIGAGAVQAAQLMIIGNDQKPSLDAQRHAVMGAMGHDTLSILDLSKPATPRIIATIPLDNTVIGPPVNLAIAPSRDIALVANSIVTVKKGDKYVPTPDDRVFVIDLTTKPPKVIDTLHLGKQPSGMAIAPDGKLALVAKAGGNAVALLTIDGDKVTYTKRDLPTGLFPYNVVISPNGKIALSADNGNHGTSDGNAKSIGVIDLTQKPVRVINHITVGDSPEGLAISPKGNIAVAVEAQGSNQPTSSWFYHKGGTVSVLKINGTNVTKIKDITVGQLPEPVTFSADGSHIYVGNFLDSTLSILSVQGDNVTLAGTMKLPGQPASARSGPQ